MLAALPNIKKADFYKQADDVSRLLMDQIDSWYRQQMKEVVRAKYQRQKERKPLFGEISKEECKLRQKEGFAIAKANGMPNPSTPIIIDEEKIKRLLSEGYTPTAIKHIVGVARSSVYRIKRTIK